MKDTVTNSLLFLLVGLHGFVSANHDGSHNQLTAPSWEAIDAEQQVIRASDFQGESYVLILHLGHSCFHCSAQLEHFNAVVDKFKDLEAEIVAIGTESAQKPEAVSKLDSESGSTANMPGSQNNAASRPTSVRRTKSFHLGVDPTKKIFQQFNAVDGASGLPLHATFLVDDAGRIRWSDIGEHPFMDSEALLDKISLIRTTRHGTASPQDDEVPDRPKVFLDKSPRIVAYQLKRLNNERLLLVERKTIDAKYAPVFEAILTRAGMSPQYREEAVAALAELNKSDSAAVLLGSLAKLKVNNRQQRQTARELSDMLFKQSAKQLASQAAMFEEATSSDSKFLRQVGFAGLVMTGNENQALEITETDSDKKVDYLKSIEIVIDEEKRSAYAAPIWQSFNSEDAAIKTSSVRALSFLPAGQDKVFSEIAPLIDNDSFRDAAVATMLKVPGELRDSKVSKQTVESLLKYGNATPKQDRTSDQFLDAMQLADQLLQRLPTDESKNYRGQLGEIAVRVVKVSTLEDEMLFDKPYFAVAAGKPVQIVLDNIDLMPHNLVICKPGKLRDVALDGLAAGTRNGLDGKQYVPKSDDVLAATKMVQAHERGRITFDAPTQAGEYPYVCTFPQHWLRMYGVMVVVDDLNAWQQSPVAPADPLGSKRQFVKKWTVDELVDDSQAKATESSLETGKQVFTEATCAACHQLGGTGGKVGPALDEVVKRWKGDRRSLIREIIEPSHRIDEKYSMHVIVTLDGVTISGIIQSETDDELELLDNPESTETIKIAKDDIDEMVKTSKSIMPKALMDNFTREEINELLHYIEASQK